MIRGTPRSALRVKNFVFLGYLLIYGVGMYWLGMKSGKKPPTVISQDARR